jgi:hypothetical protein
MTFAQSDQPSTYAQGATTPNAGGVNLFVNTALGETIESFDGALVASTVSIITFAGTHLGVRITNVSGATPIFYTVDGTTPSVSTSPELAATVGATVALMFDGEVTAFLVKLISTGVPTYTVEGIDQVEETSTDNTSTIV